ncbi:hypothetical protein DL89DRAFT_313708 [Linderina pennispora]|uniref:Protein kinase domain-containing protein n=1 Tax=Linderina pennispora TaxID=61395 RepID=A0A1Y1WDB2_9FUNG|nr:uncharacterized protein DL89DRAFT_313708 [Linderina pennispora]ORX71442.1 hypothetical protein DL89DRAFT_313708 [Linderina pennispora]
MSSKQIPAQQQQVLEGHTCGSIVCIGTKRPLSDPDQPGIDLQIYPPKRVCTSRVSDTSKTLNPSTKRKFTDDDSSLDDDGPSPAKKTRTYGDAEDTNHTIHDIVDDSLVLHTQIIARKTDSHLRAKKRQVTRNKTVGRRVSAHTKRSIQALLVHPIDILSPTSTGQAQTSTGVVLSAARVQSATEVTSKAECSITKRKIANDEDSSDDEGPSPPKKAHTSSDMDGESLVLRTRIVSRKDVSQIRAKKRQVTRKRVADRRASAHTNQSIQALLSHPIDMPSLASPEQIQISTGVVPLATGAQPAAQTTDQPVSSGVKMRQTDKDLVKNNRTSPAKTAQATASSEGESSIPSPRSSAKKAGSQSRKKKNLAAKTKGPGMQPRIRTRQSAHAQVSSSGDKLLSPINSPTSSQPKEWSPESSEIGTAARLNESSSSTLSSAPSMASYTAESSLDSRWCSDDDDETDTEADMWVKTRLIRDADAVLDIAKPRSAAGRVLASNISKHISAELEHRLNTASTYAIADTSKTQLASEAPMQNNNYRQLLLSDTTTSAMSKDERSAATANVFAGFQEWIAPESIQHQPIGATFTPPDSTCGDDTDDAKQIHISVQSFIYFVTQQIDSFISALDADALGEHRTYRRLLPCMNQECHPSNTGNSPTIEAGITTQHRDSSIEPLNSFCYADAFAVIEARPGKTRRTIDKAYAQLMQNTRSIYKAQFDRRFVFGLTVCDNEVRVCLFSNDVVFSSSALDMSTAFGRQQFIELLVYWSLCGEDQLGFDTTVYWDKDNNYGTIECPDTADESSCSAATKMYYFDKVLPGAESLFGRHTRCFLVTDERPSGDKIKPKFALKDTWPEATEDPARDRRDEVMFMRRITEELVNSDVEDLVYPKLEAGGRVSIDTDGGRFEDNTRNALGPLYLLRKPDNAAIPFRVHKRLVMSPVGEPLETVESVHELIVVLGDAMRCHTEVLRRCNILHRDISNNNILVVREEGKQPRGLLIDFDCAVDVNEHQAPNPENVGTFPYRSINNLFGSNVERTELDDWESLLYLLCLCATIGVREDYNRSLKDTEGLKIKKWHTGDAYNAACSKTVQLSCVEEFNDAIVRSFNQAQPDIEYLQGLARGLYMELFSNRALKNPQYWGTLTRSIGRMSKPSIPSKERVKIKNSVADTLLTTMSAAYLKSASILSASIQ